jgi:putrescine aminotransferase
VITDHEGREFLDFLGGYGTFVLGHRHPAVVEAVKAQLDAMPLSGKAFFNPKAAELASRLAELAPATIQYSFFVNSGAEAVEGALKFARAATRRTHYVSTIGSYHGKTMGALSVTGRDKYQAPFRPLLADVTFVPFDDVDAIRQSVTNQTAAVIVEPIQGEGGIVVPAAGYIAEIRKVTEEAGAMMIVDEVQTGMGRTGRMFACEWDGVHPDLICLAKGLGGGVMPIGAILGTAAVFDAVFSENPIAHSSTFGGNGLACAAALATLDVILRDDLCAEAEAKGKLLLQCLQDVAEQFPDLIADVRGRGLMAGLEFSEDEVGEIVVAQLMKRGICVAYALNNPRVLRFEPPLIISTAEIEALAVALVESITETSALISELVEF